MRLADERNEKRLDKCILLYSSINAYLGQEHRLVRLLGYVVDPALWNQVELGITNRVVRVALSVQPLDTMHTHLRQLSIMVG